MWEQDRSRQLDESRPFDEASKGDDTCQYNSEARAPHSSNTYSVEPVDVRMNCVAWRDETAHLL